MRKNKLVLYIILGTLGLLLLGSTIYINFMVKSSSNLTYILIGQIFIGIISCLTTLFVGLDIFKNRKNFELLFMGFLELLLVLGIVILNYAKGYGKVVNRYDYIDYMEYVSMEFNIYIYIIFISIIGLLTLNLFIKEKQLSLKVFQNANIDERAN